MINRNASTCDATRSATTDEVTEDEEEKGGLVKQGVTGRLRLEVGQNCVVEM